MKVYEVLERAKGYLEKGWIRNYQAVDSDRMYVGPNAPEAVAWCAEGAINAAGGSGLDVVGRERVREPLIEAMGDWKAPPDYDGPGRVYGGDGAWNVASFNNVEGQEATIELFKKGIRIAKAKEGIPLPDPAQMELIKEEVLV